MGGFEGKDYRLFFGLNEVCGSSIEFFKHGLAILKIDAGLISRHNINTIKIIIYNIKHTNSC